MKPLVLTSAVSVLLVWTTVGKADSIYNESGGRVVIEMENTLSPLGEWDLIGSDAAGYPSGAIGTGHLEYGGPFSGSVPRSPLVYEFKVNQTGTYDLRFRAHKRLLGNPSDKNNDAFVKMAGNFTSGNSEVPLSALLTDTKLFGGAADDWGVARKLDGNGAHLANAAYDLIGGETYTFTVSGRSTRFNLDRMIFTHESVPFSFSDLSNLPESSLVDVMPPAPPTAVEFDSPDFVNGGLNNQQGWNAENSWAVADAGGVGHASTSGNNEIATHGSPISLDVGESFSYSVNLEFGGGLYSTPTAHTYAFLSGLTTNGTGSAHVGTGDAVAADSSLQIINGTDNFRLLNNFKTIPGASNITGTELNAGDNLQFDYKLTLGEDAASTFYTVQLQNLTDGTDTGIGLINYYTDGGTDFDGIHPDLYDALIGDGAHTFLQRINPGNGGSGLTDLQINSIAFNYPDGAEVGDFDLDGDVDLDDLDRYIGNIGAAATGELELLDLDDDGLVGANDFQRLYESLVETSNGSKGTFAGDLNLDGTVDVLGDATILINFLGDTVTSWSNGDTNGDGIVDVLGDAALLIENVGRSNGGGTASTAAVPEPGSLSLLVLAGMGAIGQRRR